MISDGHEGIQKAVKSAFIGATWQMCQVHYLAILRNVPRKHQSDVSAPVKSALNGNEDKLSSVATRLEQMGFRSAANTVERFMFDLGNYRDFPVYHWRRIRTTNMVERVNAEIKRRTKVVGAFPSCESLLRLVGSILMDTNEEWLTGYRYSIWRNSSINRLKIDSEAKSSLNCPPYRLRSRQESIIRSGDTVPSQKECVCQVACLAEPDSSRLMH